MEECPSDLRPSGKWNDLPAINTTLSGYVIELLRRFLSPSTRKRASAAFVESLGSKAFNQVSLFAGQTMQVARDEESNSLQTRGIDLAATTYSSTYTHDSGISCAAPLRHTICCR